MQKNFQDFSMQEAMRLANTDAGQQLLAMLQKSDKRQLDQAMTEVNNGNYQQAAKALTEFMKDPKVRQLLKQMEG